MSVKLIHSTLDGEKLIAFCARVSSPNQENPNYEKLLAYCIKHKHWSIFQMANLCVEITTSRAIAAQILRHRSFSFQEFSQRYAPVDSYEQYPARRQDAKNRQNSIDDMSPGDMAWFNAAQQDIWEKSKEYYDEALKRNVAKEQARFLLPLNTTTKMYMNGTIRDWIHYCIVRCEAATQLEHRTIANSCWKILRENYPAVTKAVEESESWMREIT